MSTRFYYSSHPWRVTSDSETRAALRRVSQRSEARAALGAALTHHRAGNIEPALRALGEALKITTEMRAHAFLLTDDEDAARLVEEAEKHGIEPSVAGQLLEDLGRLTNIRESWG